MCLTIFGALLLHPAHLTIFSFYIHRLVRLTNPARLLGKQQVTQNFTFFSSKTANKSDLMKWYLIVWLISLQILIFYPLKQFIGTWHTFWNLLSKLACLTFFSFYVHRRLIHPARLIILNILYTGMLNRYCLLNRYLRVYPWYVAINFVRNSPFFGMFKINFLKTGRLIETRLCRK